MGVDVFCNTHKAQLQLDLHSLSGTPIGSSIMINALSITLKINCCFWREVS